MIDKRIKYITPNGTCCKMCVCNKETVTITK